MNFYKTTTIINGKLYHSFGMRFEDGEQVSYGWSITQYGNRCLTMPATKAEHDVYWDRNYRWCYEDRPMRSKVEHLTQVHPDMSVMVKVETTTFIPNRHQRKHGVRMIERG